MGASLRLGSTKDRELTAPRPQVGFGSDGIEVTTTLTWGLPTALD